MVCPQQISATHLGKKPKLIQFQILRFNNIAPSAVVRLDKVT